MDDTKVWLITGCDGGMGRAIAETVLERGDRAIVSALDPGKVADLLGRHGNHARGLRLDVTDAAAVHAAVAGLEADGWAIDVLVNNAGFGLLGPAEATEPAEYRPVFEVNFFGLAEVTRAVLPFMRGRGRGHIINTSSSGGYSASPGFAFYAASKFAVEGFSHALAQELAVFGIKVTILEPGSMRTGFAGSAMKRPARAIPDYDRTSVATTSTRMAARDGQQPGDPRRLAAVVFDLTRHPAPPLRLPLGDDSIDRLKARVDEQLREFAAWEATSRSVAFPS